MYKLHLVGYIKYTPTYSSNWVIAYRLPDQMFVCISMYYHHPHSLTLRPFIILTVYSIKCTN